VHVWVIPVPEGRDSAEAEGCAHDLAILPEEERIRCARFRAEMDRRLCTVSRVATRRILSRYAPIPPSAWRFGTGEHGRPEIAAPTDHGGIRFNLAHSHGLVTLAVTMHRRVGIDVESLARRPFDPRVARRCFATPELDWVALKPDQERERACFELWTLKEAYAKAIGRGLSFPLREVEFHFAPTGNPTIAFGLKADDDPESWEARLIDVGPDHVAALFVERSDGPSIIRRLEVPLDALDSARLDGSELSDH
jgi:4'-phosphopantetheinyl transferase